MCHRQHRPERSPIWRRAHARTQQTAKFWFKYNDKSSLHANHCMHNQNSERPCTKQSHRFWNFLEFFLEFFFNFSKNSKNKKFKKKSKNKKFPKIQKKIKKMQCREWLSFLRQSGPHKQRCHTLLLLGTGSQAAPEGTDRTSAAGKTRNPTRPISWGETSASGGWPFPDGGRLADQQRWAVHPRRWWSAEPCIAAGRGVEKGPLFYTRHDKNGAQPLASFRKGGAGDGAQGDHSPCRSLCGGMRRNALPRVFWNIGA